MNENLVITSFTITDPVDAAVVGDLHFSQRILHPMTIVGVSVAPAEDDAAATLDINGATGGAILAIPAATKATPGTWISTHLGGTQAPITVAKDNVLTYDINAGAAGNGWLVTIWALVGA